MTTFHKIVYLLLVLSVCVFSEENSTEILSEQVKFLFYFVQLDFITIF